MTRKQLEVINFILAFQKEHGYSPSLVELAEALGVSKVAICNRIKCLVRDGYLRHKKGKEQDYEVIDHPNTRGWECPKCGKVWSPLVDKCVC